MRPFLERLFLALLLSAAASCHDQPTSVHVATTARILQTLSLSVGQSADITPAGQAAYDSLPALSSSAVTFLGMSRVPLATADGPAGQEQVFHFLAMAPGQAVATIRTTDGIPAVQDTFSVEAAVPHGAFAQVNAGLFFNTCAVTSRGTGYCWGRLTWGSRFTDAFGDYAEPIDDIPMPVPGGLTFAAISGGGMHTCGVTPDGAAYCWGADSNGQLGDGSATSSSVPVAVTGGLRFKAVSAGGYHTCGLTTGGAAYCWGANGDGQLGSGSLVTSSSPVAVWGGLTFAAVGAGYQHSCGLTTGGAAYCWGYNEDGELGNGDTTSSTVPVAVAGGLSFVALSAGGSHACGLTNAGRPYCWGRNFAGALGNGTTTTSGTPVAVSGGLTFAAISAGDVITCGVTTSGAAYCWGSDGYGALGNGTTASMVDPNPTPVPVSGGLTFMTVSAGYLHACGLTTGGAVYCWGHNSEGELGNSSTTISATPVLVSGP